MAITRAQQARQMLQDGDQVLGPLGEDNLQTDFISGARKLFTPGNIGRGLAFVLSGGATSAADIAKEIAKQKILNEIQDKAGDVIGPRVKTKLIQQQNEASGTGGYQSDFSQDSDFMGGSGTAAEMGSFADGGRIGFQGGGMLVSPSKDGKRPGYRNPNEDRAREEARTQAATQQQESYERAAYDPGPSSPPAAAKGSTNVSYIDSRGDITNTPPKNVDFLFDDDGIGTGAPVITVAPPGEVGGPGTGDSLNYLYTTGVPKTNVPFLNLTEGPRNKSLRRNIDYFREVKSNRKSTFLGGLFVISPLESK